MINIIKLLVSLALFTLPSVILKYVFGAKNDAIAIIAFTIGIFWYLIVLDVVFGKTK